MVVKHCYNNLNMTLRPDKIFCEKLQAPPSAGMWPMSKLKIWVVALLETDSFLLEL